jgi:hypothetical protein
MRLAKCAGGEAIRDLDGFREALGDTLGEWMALEAVEPTVERRLDEVIHMLARLLAVQINKSRGKDTRAVKPELFLPVWMRDELRAAEQRVLSDAEVDSLFARVASAQQGPGPQGQGQPRPRGTR